MPACQDDTPPAIVARQCRRRATSCGRATWPAMPDISWQQARILEKCAQRCGVSWRTRDSAVAAIREFNQTYIAAGLLQAALHCKGESCGHNLVGAAGE